MIDKYITLPDIYITGGTSNEIVFNMLSSASVPLDLSECDVNFSISDYTALSSHPVINYSSDDNNVFISNEGSGEFSEIHIDIDPSDTNRLCGKFIYQITIKDESYGFVSYQGILFIKRNINPEFVESEVSNDN